MNDLEEIKKEILDTLDHSNFVSGLYSGSTKLVFGDYVVSGLNTTGERVIGYVTQIRAEWGAFGSDMFLIRDIDGKLARHENQSFWKLTNKQIELIKPFFKWTSKEELEKNPNLTYTLGDCKFEESGFNISKKNAPSRIDSFAMAITISKDKNGEK